MGRGIMRVNDDMAELVHRIMPPGHRIVAERRLTPVQASEWLIEGPHMPQQDGPVEIWVHQSREPGGRIHGIAHWEHLPDVIWGVETP